MKNIKNVITYLIPLIAIFLLTLVITINFSKLMPNELEKINKYELSDNENVVVFSDRIENINKSIDGSSLTSYVDKYNNIADSIRTNNTGKYSDETYEKLLELAHINNFLDKEAVKSRRGSLKIAIYQSIDMFDINIIEGLNSVQFTYTKDEQNIYFLCKNYNNKETLEYQKENIDNERIIQESKSFLQNTKIESLTKFQPTKIWLYDNEGMYMLEDTQNDIIICYDLVKAKPVGFVKGFNK